MFIINIVTQCSIYIFSSVFYQLNLKLYSYLLKLQIVDEIYFSLFHFYDSLLTAYVWTEGNIEHYQWF